MYFLGTRAGIMMLAPYLIGIDTTRLNNLNVVMDRALKGHPYVKSAIDMACWDILGVCMMLVWVDCGYYCYRGS
jgi:cis-L-3-hydroxyproline dehydratase